MNKKNNKKKTSNNKQNNIFIICDGNKTKMKVVRSARLFREAEHDLRVGVN